MVVVSMFMSMVVIRRSSLEPKERVRKPSRAGNPAVRRRTSMALSRSSMAELSSSRLSWYQCPCLS